MHRQTRRPRRKLVSFVRSLVAPFVIVLVLAGGFWFANAQYGLEVHRIATGSMEPTLHGGSLFGTLVFTTKADTLHPGNIVTFRDPDNGELVTHTFIGYASDGGIMTKGDANPTPDVHDKPLRKSGVVGTVRTHVDVFTAAFWTSPRGIALAIIAGVTLLMCLTVGVSPTPAATRRGKHSASTPVRLTN